MTDKKEINKLQQALDEIEKYIQKGSGYYIPHGAREVIQDIINKTKDGE